MSKTKKDIITSQSSGSVNLSLTCEIIETYESENKTYAKIKYIPGILKLTLDPLKGYHLGDSIRVNGKLVIETIDQIDSETI